MINDGIKMQNDLHYLKLQYSFNQIKRNGAFSILQTHLYGLRSGAIRLKI